MSFLEVELPRLIAELERQVDSIHAVAAKQRRHTVAAGVLNGFAGGVEYAVEELKELIEKAKLSTPVGEEAPEVGEAKAETEAREASVGPSVQCPLPWAMDFLGNSFGVRAANGTLFIRGLTRETVAFIIDRANRSDDAARREVAAEILSKFPVCFRVDRDANGNLGASICGKAARLYDGQGYAVCDRHTTVGSAPVKWLAALDLCERILATPAEKGRTE